MRAADIESAYETFGHKFDVVYSFNGALNCEPDLPRFVLGLNSSLTDLGYFVVSIRNSLCLSEMLAHAMVLQFGAATPRKRQPMMISVGGRDVPATYFTPWRFVQHFSRDFKVRRVIGLPTVIPPAYLSDYYVRLGRLRYAVERVEEMLSAHFPMNGLGDQTLFVFQKRKPRMPT
jgi:hypothetical protein